MGQPCAGTGGQYLLPRRLVLEGRALGATRYVTPRQTCPRPNGFGRNLRSKTRWFTGFCNSHQVSHFATFFIDARAEISVAESRLGIEVCNAAAARVGWRCARFVMISLALSAPGFVIVAVDGPLPTPNVSGAAGGASRHWGGEGWRRTGAAPSPLRRVFIGSRVVLLSRFRQ